MLNRLFVYGTLRSGYQNRYARLLRRNATLLGPARIQARKYRLWGYPAVRRSSHDDWVDGELYLLRTPEQTLAALDCYEDRQYQRVALPIRGQQKTTAWVYEWRYQLPQYRRIR